ncbi:MAG: BBP7 family outer membrane beta-barrel protein [Planctomycetota bacterium]
MDALIKIFIWRRLRPAWFATAAAWLIQTMPCAATAQELPPVLTPEPAFDTASVGFRNVPSVAEPLWTDYALTDALFWGRDNQAANVPLVTAVGSNAALITAQDLQFPVAAGVRAFYGQRNPNECGWEIGYFGVYGMSATQVATTTAPQYLQVPDPIGSQLTADGEQAILKYSSTINSAEANVFRTWQEWRDLSESWLTVDWLAGFRYVGVEEEASITTNCCTDEASVPYSVRTRNNMFGGQIGSRARWTWDRWAIEGWAKAGLLGNSEKQMQAPLVDYTGFQQRGALSATGTDVGFIGDINLSVIYRLTEVWGIRAGYNTVWINGLALAPNQFDFTNTSASGTGLNSGDGIFLSGANLGLEARW